MFKNNIDKFKILTGIKNLILCIFNFRKKKLNHVNVEIHLEKQKGGLLNHQKGIVHRHQ